MLLEPLIRLNKTGLHSVAFDPTGTLLASGSYDGTIKLWDVASGQELKTLSSYQDLVRTVDFSPNGKLLASGSFDKTVKLWDVASGQELKTLSGYVGGINSVRFSPDGSSLVTAAKDRTVRLWNLTDFSLKKTIYETLFPNAAIFSPDSKTIACSTNINIDLFAGIVSGVNLWEAASGQKIRVYSGHSRDVLSLAFTSDGLRLASSSSDRTIKLWEVSTGNLLSSLKTGTIYATSIAFSPDNKILAAGCNKATSPKSAIRMWDVERAKLITYLTEDLGRVMSIDLCPKGELVAVGSLDGLVRIYRMIIN